MTGILIRREEERERHVKVEVEIGAMQLKPKNARIARNHQKLGEGHGTDYPQSPCEATNPDDT
jgi:hypothetical protein